MFISLHERAWLACETILLNVHHSSIYTRCFARQEEQRSLPCGNIVLFISLRVSNTGNTAVAISGHSLLFTKIIIIIYDAFAQSRRLLDMVRRDRRRVTVFSHVIYSVISEKYWTLYSPRTPSRLHVYTLIVSIVYKVSSFNRIFWIIVMFRIQIIIVERFELLNTDRIL